MAKAIGIRFNCRGCGRIEASRAGQWCHDCALKQNEGSRLPIELVRLIERGARANFKYPPPGGEALPRTVSSVKVLDLFMAASGQDLPEHDRPAICVERDVTYTCPKTGDKYDGALFAAHTGERFALPYYADGEVFSSMGACVEDVPIGSWIAFMEPNAHPGIHLLVHHNTVSLDGPGILRGNQDPDGYWPLTTAERHVWVVYPAQLAQPMGPCEACAAAESEPRDRKSGTAFLCDSCAATENPDDVDTIVRSRRMLDRTGVQRIKRDTIEEILGVGGPWTIMDPLFSAPNRTGDWVWVEHEYRLHLRHEDGSRYVMAASKQPEKALELTWQKAMLNELKNKSNFEKILPNRHRARIGTTLLKDGTVTTLGYWQGTLLEIGRSQEKMNLIAQQENEREPTRPLAPVTEDGIWSEKCIVLANALADRNFRWKSASFSKDDLRKCPLSQVGATTFFRVRLYGIDGEFVAIRDDESVSRWGTITCTLQHPYNGITKLRFDDDLFVIPFHETCCGCDAEFSKTNPEVILGQPPNQIFTGECGDCFTIGIDLRETAAARTPRSIADVATSEPKKKEVKHPWDSWATVNWEEP